MPTGAVAFIGTGRQQRWPARAIAPAGNGRYVRRRTPLVRSAAKPVRWPYLRAMRERAVTVDSRLIEADGGLTLHVVDFGGDGPPLLLSHGTGLVAQVWGVLVPYLTPHFRVWALDRKGHGDSDKPPEGYGMEAAVEEYAAVVEGIGGDGWAAVGHSSGGTSLGLAAVRRPSLFDALVMADPIVFPPRSAGGHMPPNTFVDRTRDRRDHWPSAQAMYDDLREKRAYRTWLPEALWDYVRHGAEPAEDGSVRLKCPPALEARMYGANGDVDLFDAFARIPVPTLVIRGGDTDRFPRENAERVTASNSRVTLVELPGLTHFPAMEDPATVGRLAIEFLLRQHNG